MTAKIRLATDHGTHAPPSAPRTHGATFGLTTVLATTGLVVLLAIGGVGTRIAADLTGIATLANETNATTISRAEAMQKRALEVERLARVAVLVMAAEDKKQRADALARAERIGSVLAGDNGEIGDRSIADAMRIVRNIAESSDRMDELRGRIRSRLDKASWAIDQIDDTLVAVSEESALNLAEGIADIGRASTQSMDYLEEDIRLLADRSAGIQSLLITLRDMTARLGEVQAITAVEALDRPEQSYTALARRLTPLLDRLPTGGDNEFLPDLLAEFDGLSDVFVMRRAQLELEVQIQAMNDDATRMLTGVTDRLGADAASGMRETVQGGHAIAASASGIRTTGIAMLLGFLGFALAVGLFLRRQVLTPVSHASRALDEMQHGRLDAAMPPTRLREFETIRSSLEGLRRALYDKRRLEAEQAANRKRAEEEKRRVMREMADRFDREVKSIVDGVSSAATEMQATAHQMSATAEETSRQSGSVASASDQASTNVQMVATTAEELSASIAEIGRQVTRSAKIAKDAVSEAEATNETVQGLAEAAERIGNVVKLIGNIAGQTNLLALNATIEAARAGEAGKGFAVVASEVKDLASQTARATQEIAQQITSVQEETTGVVGAIDKIRAIIGQMDDIAAAIASAVEEQGASTQEIARNVQHAARGTQDVNSNIENVNRAAGDTGSAAGQVLDAALEMSRQAEGLRGQVDSFLDGVRVA